MNEPQEAESTARSHATHEPCPCREIVDTVRQYLGISLAARQHLANSRVEFLKAVREMLNARIEDLSSQAQKGTKVAVE
jgi:vacuolar-type H+-ATPase subunit E/Vma4